MGQPGRKLCQVRDARHREGNMYHLTFVVSVSFVVIFNPPNTEKEHEGRQRERAGAGQGGSFRV